MFWSFQITSYVYLIVVSFYPMCIINSYLLFHQKLQCPVLLTSEKGSCSWLTTLYVFVMLYVFDMVGNNSLHYFQIVFVANPCLLSTLSVVPPVVSNNQTYVMNGMISLLSEVCYNVWTEPPLQPLSEQQLHYRSADVEYDTVPT